MSWHYLPELAAGSSARSSSDIGSSAPWKSSRTAGKSSCGVKGTVCFPCSRSGTTLAPSMAHPGVAQWISSLRDSHANRSVQQVEGEERRTIETSGQTPSESYARWDPDSRSWRTSQTFWPMTISAKSSDRWPRAGSMRSGELFPLPKWEPRISERGSGLLPTPSAQSYGTNQGGGAGRIGPVRESLARMAKTGHWPTPRSSPNENRQSHPSPSQLDGSHGKSLAAEVGGQLNPDWVEWLMWWPIGWTDLRPLATGRFREWLNTHGIG